MSEALNNPTPAPAEAADTTGSMDSAVDEIQQQLDGEQQVDDPDAVVEEEEVVEEAPPEPKKWKLKVGGKEVEIDSEDELVKRAQMGFAANEKWEEASKMRKQMDAFVQAFEKDPFAALQKMGKDPDQLAEEYIQRRIEEMQKSPEELERERVQKELEELKAEREREKEEARQKELIRLQDQYAMQIETEINQTLDDLKDLPKSPYVVKRIADLLILGLNQGIELGVKDVVPIAQQQIRQEIKEMFSAMPEELIEAVIGKDVLNKVRKSSVMKAKAPKKPQVQSTGASELNKKEANKPVQKLNAKDFFKNLGSY